MNSGNDFFKRMYKEAIDELASGKKGTWREIPTNVLFLACFGMLYNHLTTSLARPLWFFAGSVFAGIVTFIIVNVIMS